LRSAHHLLIIDNIDSDDLSEDERGEIKDFISNLDGGKTLVLMGSRDVKEWEYVFWK